MSYNDMFVLGFEKIASKLNVVTGVATDGEVDFVVDTTKNYQDDLFNNKIIRLVINGIEYMRKITDTATSRILFTPIKVAVAASAVVGEASGGQITITAETAGVSGNEYSVKFVTGMGPSVPSSAILDPETNLLTVTIGTNELGEVTATGMDVAATIDVLPEFAATMTGAGGIPNPTTSDIPFTGGEDAIKAGVGTRYEVING